MTIPLSLCGYLALVIAGGLILNWVEGRINANRNT